MVSSSDFTGQSISIEALAEHKFTATADGSSGFSGGASDIVTITTVAETISSGNIATFDGTNLVITAGAYDVWGEALIFTDGTAAHSGLLYWRDTAQPTGTRLGDNSTNSTVSTTGIYGLNSTSIAPTFVIRAGETITLNLINHLSANNQVVQEGSYIHVKEMRGQKSLVNPDLVPVDDTDWIYVFDNSTGAATVADNGGNRVNLDTVFSQKSGGSLALVDDKVTLTGGKTYVVDILVALTGSVGNINLYDFTNGVDLSTPFGTPSTAQQGTLTGIVVSPVSDIAIGIACQTSSTTFANNNVRSKMNIREVSSATVLNPDFAAIPTSFVDLGTWDGVNLQNVVTNGMLVGVGTGAAGTGAPHGAFTGSMKVTAIGDWIQQDFLTSDAPGTVVGERFSRQSFNGGTTWSAWFGQ